MPKEFDQPDQPVQLNDSQALTLERREAQRYAFVCPAELIDAAGTRISARTTDISVRGCYIDTLNPFPVGALVRLRLTKNDQHVEFRAKVTSCHVGSGMGLIFERLTPAHRKILVSWSEGAPASPEPSLGEPAAGIATAPRSETNPRKNVYFAEKLVKVLERKGILTPSEAAELLRALES
jgi:PilZ domain